MNEDRRKSDRRVPPAVAQHAIEERAELLARIEDQAREIERLSAGGAKEYWRGRCMDAEMALKAQSSGVVDSHCLLDWNRAQPEPRPIVVGREYQVAEACARLNSPPVSAGVVDERAAFDSWWDTSPMGDSVDPSDQSQRYIALQTWQARAALTAQPDHNAQSVPDGFEVYRLAGKYCDQRCIADDSPARAGIVDAFVSGFTIAASTAPSKEIA